MKLGSYKWVVLLVELGIFYLELCISSQIFQLLCTSIFPNEDKSMHEWCLLVSYACLAFWDATWEYKDQMTSANSHAMLPDDFSDCWSQLCCNKGGESIGNHCSDNKHSQRLWGLGEPSHPWDVFSVASWHLSAWRYLSCLQHTATLH